MLVTTAGGRRRTTDATRSQGIGLVESENAPTLVAASSAGGPEHCGLQVITGTLANSGSQPGL